MNQMVIGVCKMKTCLGPVSQKAVFLLAAAQLHGIPAFHIKTHGNSRKEGNTCRKGCLIPADASIAVNLPGILIVCILPGLDSLFHKHGGIFQKCLCSACKIPFFQIC